MVHTKKKNLKKKKRLGHRYTQTGNHTRTWGEGAHPHTKRGLRGSQPVDTLIQDVQPPALGGNKCPLSKAPTCGIRLWQFEQTSPETSLGNKIFADVTS